jgi:hypothetical protein
LITWVTSGGDVGRDHDVLLARLEGRHRALTLLLAHVAVDAADREAAVGQLVDEPLGLSLRAREDHGLAAAVRLQDAADDLVLVELVGAVDDVADVRLREALVGVGRPDMDRVRHEASGERHDRAGHRRAEQLGVALRCNALEDLLDVGEEAEIEHLVGFVEDDLGRARQVEQSLACEVDEAPRGADDDLRARLQLLDLALVGLAAVDRDDARRTAARQQVHVFVDLGRELARRNHDERLDAGLGILAEALHDGNAEAEGLAGTGLGLADHVLTGERDRDRLLLDREGILDALRRQLGDDVLIDREIGERCHM